MGKGSAVASSVALALAGAAGVRAVLRSGRKTIAVTDATGPIGSAVVRALVRDGRFKVRAVVTDPSKYKTAIKGCEVVPANMTNVFSLNHALLGASYAFLVPRVIDNMEADQFTKLAKFLADAAKGAELEHCIWYCMEGPDSLNGVSKTGIPLLEAEVEAARYVRQIGLRTTFLACCMTFEAILSCASRTIDGRSHLVSMPLGRWEVPAMAGEDIGRVAAEVFSAPGNFSSQTLFPAGERQKIDDYIGKLAKATGKHIVYNEVDNEVFSRVAGRRVIGTLCRVICERNKPFLEARATGSSKKLTTKIQAFEDWAKRQVKQGGGQWDQLR